MRKQNGFSLLEVLVTLLIVSLGLLGIAGIIANSLKVNQGAVARTQASLLANDIIDRMRANRAQAAAYALASCAAAPAPDSIAETDLNEWCGLVDAALPSSSATSVAVFADKVTVTVQWDDTHATGGADDQQFVLETQL